MLTVALSSLAVAAWTVPQDPSVFTVNRDVDPPTVSADHDAITAYRALEKLGVALGWRVIPETERLQTDLDSVSVDLSFRDQDPRTIAHLIAASGGADVSFDDRSDGRDLRPVLHVISSPDPATESGRQRLRLRSSQWYQNFLADELSTHPLVVKEAMRARMHIGELMMKNGNLQGAARYFQQIWDRDRTHDYVPTALLRMAEAYLELGEYKDAELWARRLKDNHQSLPEASAATVLLGRTLLAQGEYEACRVNMKHNLARLSDSKEIVELYLLAARAEMELGLPRDVYDTMKTLSLDDSLAGSDPRQFRDFHFLYAYGALGTGKFESARDALEQFLADPHEDAQNDPRRGEAFTMLSSAYLELDQFLEARAAALEARDRMPEMAAEDRTEARKVYARTALAVGDKEVAFNELELEVRRTRDPDLILFLTDEFMEQRRYQRAMSTADLLADEDSEAGDHARYLKLMSMWKQAEQTKVIADFPARAVELARTIRDKELQSRVSEVIGRAYERMGDLQRASEAYRGILR